MTKKHLHFLLGLIFIALGTMLSACGLFESTSNQTPQVVVATPVEVIIIPTDSPEPTQVLAPDIPTSVLGQVTAVAGSPDITEEPPPASPTRAITMTPTFTITPTDTPSTPGVVPYLPVGVAGGPAVEVGENVVVDACANPPGGGFGIIYNSNTSLATQLGCPVGGFGAVSTVSAYQPFERGFMIYVQSLGNTGQKSIFVFYNNNTYNLYADNWTEGVDPDSTGQQPPSPNLFEPIRGFGKIWREIGGVRDQLGWATGPEVGNTGSYVQLFDRGEMIYLPQTGQSYVMVRGAPGTWTAVNVPYQ